MNQLVEIPKENALEIYLTDNGLDPYIAKVKKEVEGIVFDVSTRKGRDFIASTAAKIAKSKTYLDKVGKEIVDDLKKKPKVIDAERKRARDILDKLKEEVRAPLTAWEEEEKQRREAIETQIDHIKSLSDVTIETESNLIQSRLDEVQEFEIGDNFGEFSGIAAEAKHNAINILKPLLEARIKFEQEQEELARLRKEEAERKQKEEQERIAREAAERAKQQEQARLQAELAEAKAEAERQQQAAERAKQQAAEQEKMRIESAKRQEEELTRRIQEETDRKARERAQQEQQKKAEAERLEREKEAAERAKAEREAKRNDIISEAKQDVSDIVGEEGITNDIVNAIIAGNVRHITINL